MAEKMIPWGPTGELVYERTYSRPKPDGTRETWPETVRRVVDGNLALAGKHERHERDEVPIRRAAASLLVAPQRLIDRLKAVGKASGRGGQRIVSGDALVFAVLILVLLVKPTGLLGKPMREKV